METIAERLSVIQQTLRPGVQLVAVSKTKPVSAIQEAYNAGQRIFGENRVQEMAEKAAALPSDIAWHLIGHLQSNKVKYIAPFVTLIHAVDDEELLATINKEASRNSRIIDCLIQIHIAQEENKFGFSAAEATDFLESGRWMALPHVRICGLMGMATFTTDTEQIRAEFRALSDLLKRLKAGPMKENEAFSILSIGMSGDYQIAMEEGSTLVRIGTAVFGSIH